MGVNRAPTCRAIGRDSHSCLRLGVSLHVGRIARRLVGLLTGGRVQVVDGVVEFWGGVVAWLLRRIPLIGGAEAMTIGHVVLGQTFLSLEKTRRHEHVHVRQYERWGLFFFSAYFGASFFQWLKGAHPYFDNPFEVEAFRHVDETDQGRLV